MRPTSLARRLQFRFRELTWADACDIFGAQKAREIFGLPPLRVGPRLRDESPLEGFTPPPNTVLETPSAAMGGLTYLSWTANI